MQTNHSNFLPKIVLSLGFLLSLFMFPACEKWQLDPIDFPTVTTGAFVPDPVLPGGTLYGSITGMVGDHTVEDHGHLWSTDPALDFARHPPEMPLGRKGNTLDKDFETTIATVTPGKTYYYRAYALFGGEVFLGEVKEFTAGQLSAEQVLAKENVTLNPDGRTLRVRALITGLPEGLILSSRGLVWGAQPEPTLDKDQFSREGSFTITATEAANGLLIESNITPLGGKNFVRPYFVFGETVYGTNEVEFTVGDIWVEKKPFYTSATDLVGFSFDDDNAQLARGFVLHNNTLMAYHPLTDTWVEKKNFPGNPRGNAVAFALQVDNKWKAYVGTGGGQSDFYEYDDEKDAWTTKKVFPGGGRSEAAGFALKLANGEWRGYLGTGNGSNDFYEYNPKEDSWRRVAPLPDLITNWGPGRQDNMARNRATGFAIGPIGYIFAGRAGSVGFQKDLWAFDPADATEVDQAGKPMGKWTKKADLPETSIRGDAVGFSIGSKGYIATGIKQLVLNDLWEYDPGTDQWTRKADFPGKARFRAIGFAIGGRGYLGTGSADSNFFQDFWEYTPQEE